MSVSDDSSDDDMMMIAAVYLVMDTSPPKKRRYWVKKTLLQRSTMGGTQILKDLLQDDIGLNGELRSSFQNFLRLSSSTFEVLINLIGPVIGKKTTNFREPISVQDRLAITLRFLSTGDSYHSLMYLFKVSVAAISLLIPAVCDALIFALKDSIKTPTNEREWKALADDFEIKWNFPLCVGSMDGKHVVIEAPNLSGSEFYNYKGTFSIVLFAIVDASYNFIYVNIGCQGRISDGGVFKGTGFQKLLENTTLNLPKGQILPGMEKLIPHVFVADDAFPLCPNIMKPYSGHQKKGSSKRIYNYRCSRARRIVENVFGILSSTFRVFRKPLLLQPEKVEKIVLVCALLHNYLRSDTKTRTNYTPSGTYDIEDLDSGKIIEGSWRKDQESMQSLLPIQCVARKPSLEAAEVLDELCKYFVSEHGKVAWQEKYA